MAKHNVEPALSVLRENYCTLVPGSEGDGWSERARHWEQKARRELLAGDRRYNLATVGADSSNDTRGRTRGATLGYSAGVVGL